MTLNISSLLLLTNLRSSFQFLPDVQVFIFPLSLSRHPQLLYRFCFNSHYSLLFTLPVQRRLSIAAESPLHLVLRLLLVPELPPVAGIVNIKRVVSPGHLPVKYWRCLPGKASLQSSSLSSACCAAHLQRQRSAREKSKIRMRNVQSKTCN